MRIHLCKGEAADVMHDACCMKHPSRCEVAAEYRGRGRTSEFRAEQSCAISVQFASRAPSWSGSCSLFPLAVTSSLNVNSASPVWQHSFLHENPKLATGACLFKHVPQEHKCLCR